MMSFLTLMAFGAVLCLVQLLAALPWLAALDWERFKEQVRTPKTWGVALAAVLGAGVALGLFMRFISDADRLMGYGRLYGSILQVQLSADFFVLVFAFLLALWPAMVGGLARLIGAEGGFLRTVAEGPPKMGAVALAAFREGVRQPMFWLLVIIGATLLAVSLILPYFTFGDDYKMMKSIGYDVLMLVAMLFAILAAGISISDEIEGRTAITMMSKPLSRRGFLFGKFTGILLAALVMTAILTWFLNWALLLKPYLDRADKVDDPLQAQAHAWVVPILHSGTPAGEATDFVRGAGMWIGDVLAHAPGVVTGFSQVMVLLAIAAGLATRLPLVVNLVACGAMFLLGNVGPVLVQRSRELQFHYARENAGQTSTTLDMINFIAQLFDNVLPALQLFNSSAAVVRDLPLAAAPYAGYVFSVFLYAALYTGIALLVGLILFEDRDLA